MPPGRHDDASALTDEDSSFGPVPPPPALPHPEDNVAETLFEEAEEDIIVDNYSDLEKADPPQELTDTDMEYEYIEEDDFGEDVSVEIPPTKVVQRMLKEEESMKEKGSSRMVCYGSIVACCLVIAAAVIGAGFATGIFTDSNSNSRGGVAPPEQDTGAVSEPTDDSVDGVPGDSEGAQEPPPSPIAPDRPAAYKALLQSVSKNADALEDIESPEAQAFSWMVAEDPLSLDPSEPANAFRIQQRYALVTQFFASAGWANQEGWIDADDECEWFGVTCEEQDLAEFGTHQAVVRLEMERNNVGVVTPDLALLSRLRVLNLSVNPLDDFPTAVLGLQELRELLLRSCVLRDDISSLDWSQLVNLEILDLSENLLIGSLNDSFYSMSNLRQGLIGTGNLLSGSISPQIGEMQNLESFDANSNQFSGLIPAEFAALPLLRILDLSGVPEAPGLTGQIPDDFGTFQSLEELNLENNALTGAIKEQLGSLTLTRLRVGNNDFDMNDFPGFIYAMTSLVDLGMENCRLSGSIDPAIGDLVNLRILNLDANFLNGVLPEELGKLAALEELTMSFNTMNTPLPESLVNLVNLRVLDTTGCRLTGELPEAIGEMAALEELRLSRNVFTGQIPASVTRLLSLQVLELQSNALAGELPFAMGGLFNLRIFNVHRNRNNAVEGSGISGQIPVSLGNLRNLEEVRLHDNIMTGELPTEMGQIESLRYLDIEINEFTGDIPMEFSNLVNLERFFLSNNLFNAGDLPEGLCEIESLEILFSDCELSNSCSTCNEERLR